MVGNVVPENLEMEMDNYQTCIQFSGEDTFVSGEVTLTCVNDLAGSVVVIRVPEESQTLYLCEVEVYAGKLKHV